MNTSRFKNYFLLHFIVFIWGWTAILGKVITISALPLVWHRMWIAVIGVFVYLIFTKAKWKISAKEFLMFSGLGALIAIHWLCFYGSIKVSNVSVTLAVFSSNAFFTALIEPLFYKRKLDWTELFFGLLAMLALSLIFTIDTKYTLGIVLSLAAGIGSAIFSVCNGLLIRKYDARIITFYELLTGFLALTVFLGCTSQIDMNLISLSTHDFSYLILMGLVCTAFTFIISVDIMKEISPYTVGLTVNLESVYGIILAYFLFTERMGLQFYIGTGIILLCLFANGMVKKYRKQKLNQ